MQRTHSFEKNLMLGKIDDWRRSGQQRMSLFLLPSIFFFHNPSIYSTNIYYVPGEGNGNPLQYSCLEYLMDRGAWRATTHEVARVRHDLVTQPSLPLCPTSLRRRHGKGSKGTFLLFYHLCVHWSSTFNVFEELFLCIYNLTNWCKRLSFQPLAFDMPSSPRLVISCFDLK